MSEGKVCFPSQITDFPGFFFSHLSLRKHLYRREKHAMNSPQAAYPVQHICPALHGDTLKHSKHGKGKVIKVGDASIWANPATSTFRAIGGTLASIPWERTWSWVLFSYDICKRKQDMPLARGTFKTRTLAKAQNTPLSTHAISES